MSVLIKQFFKFGIVGGIGVVIDFGFTWLLKEKLKTHKYLANSVGFMLAASSNWILNRIWTFKNDDPDMLLQYGKFIGVSVVGLLIHNFIVYIFHDKRSMNFYLAKVIAVGVVMFWNFGANYLYTFNS